MKEHDDGPETPFGGGDPGADDGGLFAAERVKINFDVPEGIGAYTGPQPVTFGVPFARGVPDSLVSWFLIISLVLPPCHEGPDFK